jgi:hypothetical protein
MCLVKALLALDPAAALCHHERQEALAAEAPQDVDRRDVRVALRAALVLGSREDGRRSGAHLLLAKRLLAAQLVMFRPKRVASRGWVCMS